MTDNSTYPYLKGRGAQINPADPFARNTIRGAALDPEEISEGKYVKTTYQEVHPKSIVNHVKSPDVGMNYSINAYQGCEHGCVYCYARNTHPYWGYSAGVDFESKIMVKKNAPDLLHKFLSNKSWKGEPIVMSGNTDCYQPAEAKFNLTRALLKVFREFQHPVGIITKNSLIQRDMDILVDLGRKNLIHVIISITTLDETLRRQMEPRTASVKQRLQTIAHLAKEGIPVGVMVAPIIPGLNNHEVMEIIRISSLMGATKAGYTVVRLNGDVDAIFSDWIHKAYPEKAKRSLSQIAECHGGNRSDSRFGKRMKGEGVFARSIADQFKLARNLYMSNVEWPALDSSYYLQHVNPQLKLF